MMAAFIRVAVAGERPSTSAARRSVSCRAGLAEYTVWFSQIYFSVRRVYVLLKSLQHIDRKKILNTVIIVLEFWVHANKLERKAWQDWGWC